MGSSYYYFVASLPLVSFDGKMPMSVEAFHEDCRRLLTEKDYALMQRLWVSDENDLSGTGNRVLDAWLFFDRGFRNELAWHRANRLNKDPLKYLRGPRALDPLYAEEVSRISKMEDLWEAEKTLNKMKWRFLEDLAAGHYFDIEFLLIYALRLTMLERFQEYASPAGGDFARELRTMPLPKSSLASA